MNDVLIKNIQIETPHGFVSFDGIRKMPVKVKLKKVCLENGKFCIVSHSHGFVVCSIEIKVEDLIVGQSKLQCDDGEYYTVVSIEDEDYEDYVYDVLGVQNKDSSFFANGISHHNCSFTGSTRTLIDGDVLAELEGIEPPEMGIKENGDYLIYVPPKKNHIYAFGVDVSQGVRSDSSVVNIFDITDYRITGRIEQVATWAKDDKTPFEFAEIVMNLTKEWNNPFVIIENNTYGSIIVKIMFFDHGYDHLFYDMNKGEYGVNGNVATKPLALTHFKDDVDTKRMIIRSNAMIKELGYFEEVREGIFEARKGRSFHDDYVASAYWVSYMMKDAWFEDAYTHRLEVMGLQNNYEKPQEVLEDESILNNFMGSLGTGAGSDDNIEQSLWDMELWLSEEDTGSKQRQRNIEAARNTRIEEIRRQNQMDIERLKSNFMNKRKS